VHDFNGGILASGLFWTLPLGPGDFHVSADRTQARLRIRRFPVLDTFFFGGPSSTPATTTLSIEWQASGPAVERGRGSAVSATDPAAFLGSIAPARATGRCLGAEFGFNAKSDPGASSDRGYALIGEERNGSFL
jgi:hypothetical protein